MDRRTDLPTYRLRSISLVWTQSSNCAENLSKSINGLWKKKTKSQNILELYDVNVIFISDIFLCWRASKAWLRAILMRKAPKAESSFENEGSNLLKGREVANMNLLRQLYLAQEVLTISNEHQKWRDTTDCLPYLFTTYSAAHKKVSSSLKASFFNCSHFE